MSVIDAVCFALIYTRVVCIEKKISLRECKNEFMAIHIPEWESNENTANLTWRVELTSNFNDILWRCIFLVNSFFSDQIVLTIIGNKKSFSWNMVELFRSFRKWQTWLFQTNRAFLATFWVFKSYLTPKYTIPSVDLRYTASTLEILDQWQHYSGDLNLKLDCRVFWDHVSHC